MTPSPTRLLITGGLLFDAKAPGDPPQPRDILIEGDSIAVIAEPGRALDHLQTQTGIETLDATGRMIVPGFVNAHYHSHDALAKGLLEDMPFDIWALHSMPTAYPPRSQAELRLRVLLGAIECLRNGITTVQDFYTLFPQDEATLDTILAAYAEIGIRVVFSIALRDIGALDIAPFLPPDLPPHLQNSLTGGDRDPLPDLAFVEHQLDRRSDLPSRITWGLSPSGPQRCSRTMLEGVADIARRRDLPVFTHVYETRAQTAKARAIYPAQGGSMIRFLDEVGLLLPRTTLAHCVWIKPDEIGLLARRGSSVAHNPVSNMKLKSGIAPMRALACEGVNIALGCDNTSCGDCQNIFQAMKAFCLLAAVAEPQPTQIRAADAIRAATTGGARAVGLEGVTGQLRPGLKADLMLIDLSDMAYQPFNNATRQLVFSETGRGVETVIVDGRILLHNRRITTIDEAALRAELAGLMPAFRQDFAAVAAAAAEVTPYLLQANAKVAKVEIGLERFLDGATR